MVESIAEKVANKYPEDKIILKVLEECAELSEVLLKYLTKAEGYKPPVDKITEEAGDVIFRIMVLSKKMNLTDLIEDRVKEKAQIMYEYINLKV